MDARKGVSKCHGTQGKDPSHTLSSLSLQFRSFTRGWGKTVSQVAGKCSWSNSAFGLWGHGITEQTQYWLHLSTQKKRQSKSSALRGFFQVQTDLLGRKSSRHVPQALQDPSVTSEMQICSQKLNAGLGLWLCFWRKVQNIYKDWKWGRKFLGDVLGAGQLAPCTERWNQINRLTPSSLTSELQLLGQQCNLEELGRNS